jgi:hypothetical protein
MVEAFEDEVQRVMRSGALGRSAAYSRLLQYLHQCSIAGTTPKELDIAVEVFDRSAGFDPSQDSMVRVYVHKLRQKLDTYYDEYGQTSDQRLVIPRGQYRLVLKEAVNDQDRGPRRSWQIAAAIAIGVLIGWLLTTTVNPVSDTSDSYEQAPVWSEIFDDHLPVKIVVGDYFMFAELDSSGIPSRLIRDFGINSSDDLRRKQGIQPETADLYGDLDLTYLPIAAGSAIADLTRVLSSGGKSISVTPVSKFQLDTLQDSHVIYVGYLSGLGQLAQFVFSGSGLTLGNSYDELVAYDSGRRFVSEAGLANDGDFHYIDYGYISTFPGPADGQFVVVAGTRDEGLMQAARYLSARSGQADMAELDGGNAFEVLLEVAGLDRTSLDSVRVFDGPVAADEIWVVR